MLQKTRRDTLASPSLEHDECHHLPSKTLRKSIQPHSYLPVPVNGSGQPLFLPKLTPSPTPHLRYPSSRLLRSTPNCSCVSLEAGLPLQVNTQNHTPGVQSTNHALFDDSRDLAVAPPTGGSRTAKIIYAPPQSSKHTSRGPKGFLVIHPSP